MIRVGLLFLVLAFSATIAHAAPVRIADGDCAGLHAALASANSKSTILLARGGHYPVCDLSLNTGTVEIDGQGATFQFLSGTVAKGATLTIRNASITSPPDGLTPPGASFCDSALVGLGGPIQSNAALCNDGALTFEEVSIHDLALSQTCIPSMAFVCEVNLLIDSKGELLLRNVTVADSNLVAGHYTNALLVQSDGALEIYNVTLANVDIYGPAISSASTTVANSIFSSNGRPLCNLTGPATSLGGNVATEASCGLDAGNGDHIVPNLQLGAFGDHGGLVPTQALTYFSPARTVGVAQNCEAVDARGYTRARGGCDAGAYEYNGGSNAVTGNGINGSFYDAAANGHYVWIERVHDTGDILVTWLTFDRNGRQAWVAGVGSLAGNRLHVDMAQNIGGVLQPGGPPTGSTTRPWGSVDIDLTSCLLAQFAYHSTLPEFGSGQFPLDRLTVVSDLGCSD